MAKLTAKARKKLPKSSFALPGSRYPIHDRLHAGLALGRAKTNATPEQKATIMRAVAKRYPSLPAVKKLRAKRPTETMPAKSGGY